MAARALPVRAQRLPVPGVRDEVRQASERGGDHAEGLQVGPAQGPARPAHKGSPDREVVERAGDGRVDGRARRGPVPHGDLGSLRGTVRVPAVAAADLRLARGAREADQEGVRRPPRPRRHRAGHGQGPRPRQGGREAGGPGHEGQLAGEARARLGGAARAAPGGVRRGARRPRLRQPLAGEPRGRAAQDDRPAQLTGRAGVVRPGEPGGGPRVVRAQRGGGDGRSRDAPHLHGVRKDLLPRRREARREGDEEHQDVPRVHRGGAQGEGREERQGDPGLQGLREGLPRDAAQPEPLPRVHRGGPGPGLEAAEEKGRMMVESIDDVVADCAAVFRFEERKPQERAHDYLRERRVARGCDDTAMQCACEDMVRRAYRVGLTENATEVARETARVIAEGIMGVLDDE